jgi:small GTP-binding protein
MPINAGYEYFNAEKKYFAAKTIDEQIACLEEMIRAAPKHKSSENFVAELKNRLRRLIEKQEKSKSVGKSGKKGVKKEGFQVVLIGLPNSGKSSLLAKITNARPLITQHPFATKEPEIGTLTYQGIKAQIVDLPSIGSEFFDIGVVNTADLVLIVVESIQDIEKITPMLTKTYGKHLIAISKCDLLNQEQLRKLEQTIKSKKINAIPISTINDFNIDFLKSTILKSMDVIRVYTKEPGKPKAENPCVLPINSTVKDVAESIRHGFAATVRETRITGPSSKFPNQKVGLEHVLKDLDIVEFHTR